MCNESPLAASHARSRQPAAWGFLYCGRFAESRATVTDGGCATVRIKSTDERERLWETLRDATGKGHTSQALDDAARFYNRMAGESAAVPEGKIDELLQQARAEGSLTVEEIAEILDTPELPVDATVETSVGREE